MKLKYNLTENDYINYNIEHIKNSKSIRKSMIINRYITPLIFLVVPFFLYDMETLEFKIYMFIFICLFIVWISFFDKYVYAINRKRLKKVINESNNDDLYGEKILEIIDEVIKITTYSGENIIKIVLEKK